MEWSRCCEVELGLAAQRTSASRTAPTSGCGTFRTGVLSDPKSVMRSKAGHDTPSHFNPDDEYTARASQPLPHQAVEHDRGEQHETGIAVRFEHGEAQRRCGDIEAIHGHSADRNTAGTRLASSGPISPFARTRK